MDPRKGEMMGDSKIKFRMPRNNVSFPLFYNRCYFFFQFFAIYFPLFFNFFYNRSEVVKKKAFQGISAPIFILFDNIKMLVCSVFGFYCFKFFISTSSNPRQSSSYNEWRWYLFTSLASLPVSYLILHYAIDQTILMFFFSRAMTRSPQRLWYP